jgi:hypothetical protein
VTSRPMKSDEECLHELTYYTLAHPDPSFIHQHVVDAYAAQHADEATKPITIVCALLGLYLHVEKHFTGRQVQKAHMQLARYRREWVRPALPEERGAMTIGDVVAATPEERDAHIHQWCASVWQAWAMSHKQIKDLARTELGID